MIRKTTNSTPTAMFNCRTFMNSMMDSVRVSMVALWRVYSKFCEETSLHGLKHTVAENLHFLERIIWLILTMGAFAGAVYCGLNQLSRYNLEPVVVSLQRDYRSWWTVFPAVTACFYQRTHSDKMKEVIQRRWNVTSEDDPEKYIYYQEFIELIADVSFRTNLQSFWKYQSDATVKNIDLLQLALDVHPNWLLNVTLSDVNLKATWYPVMTEEGLCQTFNSEYAEFQLIPQEGWKKPELFKCHYNSPECYVRIESIDGGVRYFVHSPQDIATAISNPTGEVLQGDELITEFKAVEIQAASRVKSLRPEQRRCKYPDEWISSSIKAYSFGLCQMNCRSRMAAMFCGCRPFFIVKGDGDVCDAHGMACIGRNVEILINMPKNLAKCPCLPQCTEINYYSHNKKNLAWDYHRSYNGTIPKINIAITGHWTVRFNSHIKTHRYDSIKLLHTQKCPYPVWFFPNMNDTATGEALSAVRFDLMPPKFRLHRDVIFSLEDLFASLGGTTALFVGASVLTVVEIVLFILRLLVEFLIETIQNC